MKINRAAWDRGAALSRVEASADCIAALKKYALLLREFPESDFERKDLPTGFSFELWRYMLLDSLVHPVQHLLYHSATRGDFPFARFALHEAGETLLAFSGGKADSFDLFEFASDPAELREAVFAFGAACPGDEYARVLVQRHCGSLYPALRRQFSLSFAMLRNLVEHSPAAVWDEKAGGFVYWQQLLHALSGVSCWLRRGDEPFREPFAEKRLYPELDGEPESMLTREELLLFLEEADETAGRFVFGGNDAWLAEKPVADSRYTNLELLGMQIRHVMYHVANLRKHFARTRLSHRRLGGLKPPAGKESFAHRRLPARAPALGGAQGGASVVLFHENEGLELEEGSSLHRLDCPVPA